MDVKRNILVTGSHRSGTTWVGRMIDLDPQIHYIFEPFNLTENNTPCKKCGYFLENWFHYVLPEEHDKFYRHFSHLLHNPPFDAGAVKYKHAGLLKLITKRLRLLANRKKQRALIKDPIALYSSEWLSETFNLDVVIMIRHPAAFVSSLKRLNWGHPFSHFLNQDMLMTDHLSQFKDMITLYSSEKQDIIDQAILLWKTAHFMISLFKKKHPNWHFIRHEDISANPIREFEMLYNKLNIPYTEKIKAVIKTYTSGDNPSGAEKGVAHAGKLDSKANIHNWKKILSPEEINKIRSQVEDISSEFYSDNDW
ncbi:MAG: sulfotransferase [Spirochaetota bacterium]|nr:sulfotransferase [Spirochaetota bacterium]